MFKIINVYYNNNAHFQNLFSSSTSTCNLNALVKHTKLIRQFTMEREPMDSGDNNTWGFPLSDDYCTPLQPTSDLIILPRPLIISKVHYMVITLNVPVKRLAIWLEENIGNHAEGANVRARGGCWRLSPWDFLQWPHYYKYICPSIIQLLYTVWLCLYTVYSIQQHTTAEWNGHSILNTYNTGTSATEKLRTQQFPATFFTSPDDG
jgi:hypothetical protein